MRMAGQFGLLGQAGRRGKFFGQVGDVAKVRSKLLPMTLFRIA